MASLLLYAGQSVLLKLLSEDRVGRWITGKALHRESLKQQSNKISVTWLGERIPFRSRMSISWLNGDNFLD